MTKAKLPPSSSGDAPKKLFEEEGLFVVGTVVNRWKKLLENGLEMVNYQIGDLVVTVYGNGPDYYPVGSHVVVQVRVNVYTTKSGTVKYSLVVPTTHRSGEF
jgi:hypothetical protein